MNENKKFVYHGVQIEIPYQNYKHQKNEATYDRLKNSRYENEEISFILKNLKAEDRALDLGASLGVSSCIIASKLNDSSNLVAVEANPELTKALTNNKEINNLNFHIEHAPASSINKEVNFNFNGLSLSGSIVRKSVLESNKWGEYQSISLKTITPIDIENKYDLSFNFLSCDIEGEEYNLLNDLYDYFKNFDTMIVEFHFVNHTQEERLDIHKKYSTNFDIKTNGNTSCFIKKS